MLPEATGEESERAYSRKSLFLREKEYRIADLQDFLKHQGIMTVLIEGRLSTSGNKLQIYFDKGTTGQIRFEGLLCKEYFIVRGLIY